MNLDSVQAGVEKVFLKVLWDFVLPLQLHAVPLDKELERFLCCLPKLAADSLGVFNVGCKANSAFFVDSADPFAQRDTGHFLLTISLGVIGNPRLALKQSRELFARRSLRKDHKKVNASESQAARRDGN